MQFTTFLAAFTALSASLIPSITHALVIPPAAVNVARDVFVPTITSPVTGTIWVIGEQTNVTWDTSNAPENISNGAAVLLRKGGVPLHQENGDSFFIVENFDLRAGFVEFTVPDVLPGDDYSITLFGDSGNISDDFSISDHDPEA